MRHRSAASMIMVVTCTLFVSACTARQASAPSVVTNGGWDSVANGKSLYFKGKDIAGARMTAQPTPLFQRCVDCHRVNGSGGKRFADGAVSADLRHAALVTHQRHPYTLPLLERAIASGIDNEGKPLDKVMPHWRLSQRDLHDVAHYVLTQLK